MCCPGMFLSIFFATFCPINLEGGFYINTDVTLFMNMCCFTFVIFLPTFL